MSAVPDLRAAAPDTRAGITPGGLPGSCGLNPCKWPLPGGGEQPRLAVCEVSTGTQTQVWAGLW